MELFVKAAKETFTKKSKQNVSEDIKVKFVGRLNLLPKNVLEEIQKIEEETKNNKKYQLNFAMAYGGREEIIDAIKKLVELKEEIKEENLTKHLYLQDSPDLIIRTGGEKRTSNFLTWQSTYSEWIFLDKKWPEFEE